MSSVYTSFNQPGVCLGGLDNSEIWILSLFTWHLDIFLVSWNFKGNVIPCSKVFMFQSHKVNGNFFLLDSHEQRYCIKENFLIICQQLLLF